MKLNRIKYYPLIILLLVGNFYAQELSGISGSFVDLGFGTRAAGMGNAFTAEANDANAVFWNSAGLVSSEKIQVDFNYLNQLGLVPYSSIGVSLPLSKKDAVGAGFIYSGDATLKELTFIAGYARKFGKLVVGGNLKYRYASFGNNGFNSGDYIVFDNDEIRTGEMNKIYGNGNGFGVDLGIRYLLNNSVTLGIAIKDVLSPFTWNSQNNNSSHPARGKYSEALPLKTIFGVSVNSWKDFIINADYQPAILRDETNIIRFGIEYTLLDIISFRTGTQQFINSLSDEKYSFGIGFGYNFSGIQVKANYAYILEELANTSRFSIGVNF